MALTVPSAVRVADTVLEFLWCISRRLSDSNPKMRCFTGRIFVLNEEVNLQINVHFVEIEKTFYTKDLKNPGLMNVIEKETI